MKWLTGICAIALLAAATHARASSEVTSGPQVGDKIGPFNVTKCAGPEDDVKVGDNLCYRCKYGAKPMVMVFTRKADDQVATLVKKLDKAVEKNSDKQLRAFVSFLGDDRDESEKRAKQLAADAENVPMVVPDEAKDGPDNYGINPDAAVTVIVAREGKVVASHGYSSAPDSEDIKQIMHDVNKALE